MSFIEINCVTLLFNSFKWIFLIKTSQIYEKEIYPRLRDDHQR